MTAASVSARATVLAVQRKTCRLSSRVHKIVLDGLSFNASLRQTPTTIKCSILSQ